MSNIFCQMINDWQTKSTVLSIVFFLAFLILFMFDVCTTLEYGHTNICISRFPRVIEKFGMDGISSVPANASSSTLFENENDTKMTTIIPYKFDKQQQANLYIFLNRAIECPIDATIVFRPDDCPRII